MSLRPPNRIRMRPTPLFIRANASNVSNPLSKHANIRPGLGDPAPYCNCSSMPTQVSNNFVTLLVSAQYLLILCKGFCKDKKPTTTEKASLALDSPRSHEVGLNDPSDPHLLDELLAKLAQSNGDQTTTKKPPRKTTRSTSTTTTTTSTSSTSTTTTLSTTKPHSLLESYLSSIKSVAPILESYFHKKKSSNEPASPSPPPLPAEPTKGSRIIEEEEKEEDEVTGRSDKSSSSSRVKKSKVSESAFGGKRWRALSCPSYCPKEGDPVCGSDGVIYKSDCDMRKRTCNRDVISVDASECTLPKGSKCEHKCDKDKDLVCGTDGRTYLNKCYLQVEFCERGIEFGHFGSCLNSTSAAAEKCPKSCNAKAKSGGPVCGSDGNVYQSECEMKLQTCGQGVVSVDRRHCKTTEHCDSGCWRISRLTCGSDGKLYNNGCQMLRKNCGKQVFEVPVPYCLNKLYRTDCPLDCSNEPDAPVCASDENIYRNACEMKKMTCGFPLTRYEKIVAVEWSLCASKSSICAQMQCPEAEDINLVCGNDGVTYGSACLLSKATCTAGVQTAHVGACADLSKEEECPKDCQGVQDKPVCGSDGNAYKSECDLRLRTCGQRVTLAPLSNCQATKFCEAECPPKAQGKMVCGSDGQFYDSECEMRKKHCGKHVYVSAISVCLQNFKFVFSGCGRVCPDEYDPVCGTDEKTYSNQCFMEMENCRARSLGGVTRKYFGKCGEPKQTARHYLYKK